MPISDVYTVDSGLVSVGATTITPVLELRPVGTKRAFIVGIRMKIGVTGAVAGNDVLFTLARSGNGPTGGTAANIRANDTASAAALNTAFIGSWTIAPTAGNTLAEWVLPQTTGSMWEEFPPLGYEWVMPSATGSGNSVVGFVTPSVVTSTPVEFQFIFSE